MSLNSSDDDIPGLESVSGSEYVGGEEDSQEEEDSEDDAPGIVTDWLDPKSPHYINAKKWLGLDVSVLSQHLDVMGVYVLSPFLYGHAHQSDRWLNWCHQVGLLKSDVEFNLEILSEKELLAVDVILKALSYVGSTLTGRVDDIPKLLQLAEDIELLDSVSRASRLAHKKSWFMILIDQFRKSADTEEGVPRDILYSKNNFVEIGCLYVINQAAEHVMKEITGETDFLRDFIEQLKAQEESGKMLKEEGEEQEKNGDFDQAIETYTTAIICCPYYYELYISRAYAYMEVQKFRASVADGLRAVHLKPGTSRGFICYIQALKACGDAERVKVAIDKFNKRFPKEKEHLKKSIEQLRGLDKKIRVPTEKEEVLNEKLLRTCKQASEAYLAGSFDEAIFYYQEALVTTEENHAWQICWVFSDCERFLVSLHFSFGMALLKKGNSENVEKALAQFNLIISKFEFSHFPAVYYGIGKSLAFLHRHSEALVSVEKGLGVLPSYRLITLTWPGTNVNIIECLPHEIEIKLHHLQQLCEPMKPVDVVCRYANCLNYHTSSDICFGNTDYKGHVRVQCLEGCCISYHPACWRKFKSDSVIGADRDFLTSMCPTPDCGGRVKIVSVFDSGGLKIRLGAESTSVTTPTAPPSTLYLAKENKRQTKQKKKSNSDTPDTVPSKVDTPKEGTSKEGTLKKSTSKEDTPKEGTYDTAERQKEGMNFQEDLRKVEDSLAIINKHVREEEELEKESGPVKTHKVKKKSKASKTNSEHWNDLFTLPSREGALTGLTTDEDDSISKWEPDPSVPFQPPEHLRDIIDKFETDEAPSIGLPSRPVAGSGAPQSSSGPPLPPAEMKAASTTTILEEHKDNIEFIRSLFGQIVRTHGPLDPCDIKIVEPLAYLPEDNKSIIYKYGGITNILVTSGRFTTEKGLLCPIEEAGVVASSMMADKNNSSSTSTSKKKKKKSKKENTSAVEMSQKDEIGERKKKNGDGVPSAKKYSSMNGLLSTATGGGTKKIGRGGISVLEYIRSGQNSREVETEWNVTLKSMTPPVPSKVPVEATNTVKDSETAPLPTKEGEKTSKSSKPSKDSKKKSVLEGGKKKLKTENGSSVSENSGKTESREDVFHRLLSPHRNSNSKLPTHNVSNLSRESSQNSTSGSEGGGCWTERNPEKRNMFSPTNSTSSASSSTSSSSALLHEVTSRKTGKMKNKKTGESSTASHYADKSSSSSSSSIDKKNKSSLPLILSSTMVQTEAPLLTDKWVMTDTLPPVENFKDRYESMAKMKKDSQVKLERCEDQKFKLQKSHKREMEKILAQSKQEAKEEYQHKLKEFEEKLKNESVKVETAKKESTEQLRATKAEIKSLTDKVERLKKENLKKEQQHETRIMQLNGENERLQADLQKSDECSMLHKDTEIKATVRATNAEIEVLSMCQDLIVKPLEQKLRGIDNFCVTIPQGSDAQRECIGYREKVKNAMTAYQNAVEDQIRQVSAGRNISTLNRVPPPVVPSPPNLAAMMMQPGYVPMMNMPSRGPFPMGGMVDPSMMMNRMPRPPLPPPMGGVMPVSMAPPFLSQMEPESDPGVPSSIHHQGEQLDPASSLTTVATASPSEVVDSTSGGLGGGKKSSFDRIVEKLCPLYPHYARDDFKAVLREVRRNNNNTLSGLSLDSIAQQVKVIIDQREKKGISRGGNGSSSSSSSSSSKGKVSSRSHHHNEKKTKKPRLPPVAVAPPPVSSQTDYDNENYCVICYEEMRKADSSRLNCGHLFHSGCIRSWFKEQSTCPTCRNHSLLVDEYPTLH